MVHAYDRRLRVADLIKRELATLLLVQGRSDPRFTFVSVSAVELSRDYSHAEVLVTVLDDTQIPATLIALNKAARFFRYKLAQVVNMRATPKLHFHYDASIKKSQRILQLLKEIS